MQIKLGFGKRITALILAFCCVFSMFPSALAAEDAGTTENKAYRYIWLISQPGFSVRIEKPSAGHTGVYFKNMTTKEDGGEQSNWLDTFLYTDPKDGQQYYVLTPVESSAGKDPGYDGTNLSTPDNSSKGGENVFGDHQDGVGYLRLYCQFRERMLPNSSVPAWSGATFKFEDDQTKPFNETEVNEDNRDTTYWAGNSSGGEQFYIAYNTDSWKTFVTKANFLSPTDTSTPPSETESEFAPAPYSVRYVSGFSETKSTYYYAQVRVPKHWVDKYVEKNGYMTDTGRTIRKNWANYTMFRFVSDMELPDPSEQHEVIR